MADVDRVRALLLDRQADIAARAAGMTVAPTDTGGISFGKRVGDGTSIAVERLTQVAAHELLLVQSEEVARALAKLDEAYSNKWPKNCIAISLKANVGPFESCKMWRFFSSVRIGVMSALP